MSDEALIEQLADAEHENWASWMEYVFRRFPIQGDGSMVIIPLYVEHWQEAMKQSRAELSEGEKLLYRRNVVERLLPIIQQHMLMRDEVALALRQVRTLITYPETNHPLAPLSILEQIAQRLGIPLEKEQQP